MVTCVSCDLIKNEFGQVLKMFLISACSLPTTIGIDVNIKDNRGLTALDIVRELPSQKSQHIAALIEGKQCSSVCGQEGRVWGA